MLHQLYFNTVLLASSARVFFFLCQERDLTYKSNLQDLAISVFAPNKQNRLLSMFCLWKSSNGPTLSLTFWEYMHAFYCKVINEKYYVY